MKLVQLTSPWTIYCDLDGVLADFIGSAEKVLPLVGFKPSKSDMEKFHSDHHVHKLFWEAIGEYQKKYGNVFWRNLELMPGAHKLWDYIKDKNVQILSAAGKPKFHAQKQKREWVKKHLGNVKVNLVEQGADKAKFATQFTVLIDDQTSVLNPFIQAGGKGIHFTSADEVISKLKSLGI
jgi:HAD superfamily hydrolase (TIGR01509 family)